MKAYIVYNPSLIINKGEYSANIQNPYIASV